MTARERRIAELAAEDLESWARQLPLGSETRRDLQQTARVYRFAARVGAGAVALRPVPDIGAEDGTAAEIDRAAPPPGADPPPGPPNLVEVPPPVGKGLGRGA